MRVVVIGAGVGGLTTAALLARAGLGVTVLEAHTYPGGSAGTFYHRGYRFDAGATLLAGFDQGGIFSKLSQTLGTGFPLRRLSQGEGLMRVWLPGGRRVDRLVGREQGLAAQVSVFGKQVEPFWEWQERRAEALWSVAEGLPFPPAGFSELVGLASKGIPWAIRWLWDWPGILADFVRPTSSHAPADPAFRRFLDAQLLIASQAGAADTYALFGAAALDLPHRGPVMPLGGMGAVAQALAGAVELYGGRVLYRHRAETLTVKNSRVTGVEARLGGGRRGEKEIFEADVVIANLTPGDLEALYPGPIPRNPPPDAWGAFMLHAALPQGDIPAGPPYRQWAGEGDWTFISLGDYGDTSRAPAGMRVLSASVHTRLGEWRGLGQEDYQAKKRHWQARVERQVERIIPGFRESARLILAGTPRTYAFYTKRQEGWVGGYPQTHPLRFSSPKTRFPNLLRVGETIFPGQSVPAVAMGGWRVAQLVLGRLGVTLLHPQWQAE